MVFCVGLTGNIASGKTTVSEIFSSLGIIVFNADRVAKELTLQNTAAYKEIASHYGQTIILENGDIDRRELREIIFANPKERTWLENLLHPLIRDQLEQNVTACTSPYCIVEIPLLFDKKNYPYLDRVLVITASAEIQVSRVMARDNCSKKQALAILNSQPSAEQRLTIADDIIVNDTDFTQLQHQIEHLHHRYLQLLTLP